MVNQTSQSPNLIFGEFVIAPSSLTRNHGVATPLRTHRALPRAALDTIDCKEIGPGAANDARDLRQELKTEWLIFMLTDSEQQAA